MTPRTGRPREFDPDVALQQAMEAFWERGYDGTSMADLMEATGLQKGSLYKAFGDKHELYMTALRRYLEAADERTRALFEADGSAADAVRGWLEHVTTDCSRAGGRGCFGVNAMVERGGQDPQMAKLVDQHFALLVRRLEEVIARGQAAGEFRDDVPAADLADLLTVFLSGMNAKARGPLSKARAGRLIDGALSALDP